MREGKKVFLHIGLQFKLRKCSLQNLSSSKTSASKTSCASQPLWHSIKRCKDLVISLQTSPMIKKLDIILPVTRASFLAEMLQQDIISTTSSRIPEIFSGAWYKHTVVFEIPKNTQPTNDLKGKPLTLFFVGNKARLVKI